MRCLSASDSSPAAATGMAAFSRRVGATDYPDLHQWSVNEPDEFWSLLWHECAMAGDRGDRVIERHAEFAATRFFPDATLSFLSRIVALPDSEFLVNLGDWPLVQKSAGKPIPMISWCKTNDTYDVLWPTYELTEATTECMGR